MQIVSLAAQVLIIKMKSFSDFLTKSELYSHSGVSISALSGKDMPLAIFGFDELLHTTSLLLVTECITLQNSGAKLFATVVAVKCGVGGGHYFVSRNMLPCKDTRHSSWFGANLVVQTPL